MNRYLYLTFVLLIPFIGFAQGDYYSKKLSNDGGIGKLIFNTSFKKIPPYFSNGRVVEDEEMIHGSMRWKVNPTKAGVFELYGLKVTAIEADTDSWVNDDEEEVFELVTIVIRLAVPGDQETLTAFYDHFSEEYAPEINSVGFYDGFALRQWLADHKDCGILMSLPAFILGEEPGEMEVVTLEGLQVKKTKTLDLKLIKGCGG